MERILIASAVLVVALVIAVVMDRRRPDVPTRTTWPVPVQVDRADFLRPDAQWLVVLFSSSTCASCEQARAVVQAFAGADVAVHDVDEVDRRDLHQRYGIEAVPLVIVADAQGVVRASHVGVPVAADLEAALAGGRA